MPSLGNQFLFLSWYLKLYFSFDVLEQLVQVICDIRYIVDSLCKSTKKKKKKIKIYSSGGFDPAGNST